jgi:hypothetical protein
LHDIKSDKFSRAGAHLPGLSASLNFSPSAAAFSVVRSSGDWRGVQALQHNRQTEGEASNDARCGVLDQIQFVTY